MLLLCKKFISTSNASHYTPGQVLVNLTSGSTTVEILDNGIYELRLVGGGGGASLFGGAKAGSGGSGSAFVGQVRLTKGTYTASAGALGANVNNSTGRAGTGGNSYFGSAYTYGGVGGVYTSGGSGGSAPLIPYTIISSSVNTAGASGTTRQDFLFNIGTCAGGASKYGGYGKGSGVSRTAGQSAKFVAGTAGYVYLAYVGR